MLSQYHKTLLLESVQTPSYLVCLTVRPSTVVNLLYVLTAVLSVGYVVNKQYNALLCLCLVAGGVYLFNKETRTMPYRTKFSNPSFKNRSL